jgi:hypothetical protein
MKTVIYQQDETRRFELRDQDFDGPLTIIGNGMPGHVENCSTVGPLRLRNCECFSVTRCDVSSLRVKS